MAYNKERVHAKIGTHGSTTLVLWSDKPYKVGDKILAMRGDIYDSLHSSWRRLKKCNYWEEYRVTDTDPILFVDR